VTNGCVSTVNPASKVETTIMTEKSKSKKKNKLPRTLAPERNPEERRHDFKEVTLGYTPAMAQLEASRCIQCKKPKCVLGCPVRVGIPEFINLVAKGKFLEAAEVVKKTNAFPGITGRVCPQEDQCEKHCVIGIKGEPINIGQLERFVADYARRSDAKEPSPRPPATGKKVAIIGSGPAGLAAAGDLAKRGHEVVLFEALHEPGAYCFMVFRNSACPRKSSNLNWKNSNGSAWKSKSTM